MPEEALLKLILTYATPSAAVIVFSHWVLRPLVHQFVNERMGTQRISNGVASNKELEKSSNVLKGRVEELDLQLNNHTATKIREMESKVSELSVDMGIIKYKVEAQGKAIDFIKDMFAKK